VGGSVAAQQQVWRSKTKEVEGVGLKNLAVMQEAAQLVGGGGNVFRRQSVELVDCLGRRQVVAHRADAAEALHQYRHLPVGVALDEPLKAAEFDDVKTGIRYLAGFIQMYGDPAVTLDAGDGLYDDFFGFVIPHETRIEGILWVAPVRFP